MPALNAKRLVLLSSGVAALLVATCYAEAGKTKSGWTIESIRWQTVGANGTRYSLLEGRRDRAGVPFSYAFHIPAGVWDGPHYHSATARVFVAKGALEIGYGSRMDKSKAARYLAGSYVIVPAGTVHFDGSDEDTLIIGTAIGPWATVYRDGSNPASAGTPTAVRSDRR